MVLGASLIAPDLGMIFWTFLIFLLTWLILGKFVFKPIAGALREREDSIKDALREADKAKEEMQRIQADNAAALRAQQEESAKLMREAKETKEQIIRDAKVEAKEVTSRMIEEAKREIDAQKGAAITEVKNSAGKMAVDVAERILREQLSDPAAQVRYADSLIKEIKLN